MGKKGDLRWEKGDLRWEKGDLKWENSIFGQSRKVPSSTQEQHRRLLWDSPMKMKTMKRGTRMKFIARIVALSCRRVNRLFPRHALYVVVFMLSKQKHCLWLFTAPSKHRRLPLNAKSIFACAGERKIYCKYRKRNMTGLECQECFGCAGILFQAQYQNSRPLCRKQNEKPVEVHNGQA